MSMFSALKQPLHKTERQFRKCPVTRWKVQILLVDDSVRGCCLQTKCIFKKHLACLLNEENAVGQERLYLGSIRVKILSRKGCRVTVEVLEGEGWGKQKGDVFQTHRVNVWRIIK
jgi:hypothetical protein